MQVGTGGPHDKSVTYMPIQKKQIRIMDGDVDVTPQPLLQVKCILCYSGFLVKYLPTA